MCGHALTVLLYPLSSILVSARSRSLPGARLRLPASTVDTAPWDSVGTSTSCGGLCDKEFNIHFSHLKLDTGFSKCRVQVESSNKGLFPYYIISYNKQGSFQMITEDYTTRDQGLSEKIMYYGKSKICNKVHLCLHLVANLSFQS